METNTERLTHSRVDIQEHYIRLLRLQPGINDETIECSLDTVKLSSKPLYEALSYEWGDAEKNTLKIKLNNNFVFVRDNLWWALYYLRQANKVRTLWIDALCINQENTLERNYQVARMKDIYSNAVKVVAWIGREPEDEEFFGTAIAFLHELNTGSVDDFPYALAILRGRKKCRKFTAHKIKWDALGKLCCRSYWSRLWIIQEVVLASDLLVQCGKMIFSWQLFSKACSHFRNPLYRSARQHIFTIIKSAPFMLDGRRSERRKSLCIQDQAAPLAELLIQFYHSSCRDLRDKIFGLRSLSQTCCSNYIQVDYSIGLTQLCAQLLEHHLTAHASLDGNETLVITQKVLQALGMEIRANFHVDRLHYNMSVRAITTHVKVPVQIIPCGKIVCLRSIGRRYTWKDNYSYKEPFLVSSLISLNRMKPFTNIDSNTAYLNPESDHYCNRIASERDHWGRFGIQSNLSPLLLGDTYSVDPLQRLLKLLAKLPNDGETSHAIDGEIPYEIDEVQKHEAIRIVTEEDFWNYLLSQQAHLGPSKPVNQGELKVNKRLSQRWRDLDLKLFLTSTGMTGTVTRNVKLGDQVYRICGGVRQLAIISTDTTEEVTGKGLELSVDYYPPEFPYADPRGFIEGKEKTLKVDTATLLYLCGYF